METVAIPCTEDGFPLVDMQVVGEVLERYPDLRMSYEEFLALDEDFHGDRVDERVTILGGRNGQASGDLRIPDVGVVDIRILEGTWARADAVPDEAST